MAPLLDFCEKCCDKRVRDVKDQLQKLFSSRDEVTENECGLCCREIVGGNKPDDSDKSERLIGPDCNVLEHGRSGKDSKEPVFASQSERMIEVTNEPGVALRRSVYNDGDDDDDNVGKTSLMVEIENEPLDGPYYDVLKHGRNGKDSEEQVLASHSRGTIELTSVQGVALRSRVNDDANYDNDEDDCKTSLMVEIKSKSLDGPDCNVLEHGRNGEDSEEPVLASQSERKIKVTTVPGEALQRIHNDDGASESSDDEDDGNGDDDNDDFNEEGVAGEINDVEDAKTSEREKMMMKVEEEIDCLTEGKIPSTSWSPSPACTVDANGKSIHPLEDDVLQTESKVSTEVKFPSRSPCPANTVDANETSIHRMEDYVQTKSEAGTPSRAHRELRALRREVLDMMGNSANKDKPYQCNFCNLKPFQTVSGFLRHVAKHSVAKTITEPYQCRKCSKTFRSLQKWVRHTRERLYKCTHKGCNRMFIEKSDLKKHSKVHRAREKYPCERCGCILGSKSALVQHIKLTHEKIKDYICRFCGWRFGIKHHLEHHEKTHTGERPFKCDQCDKTFIRKENLKIHKLTHTSEHPHQCDKCGKGFKCKMAMKTHQKNVHEKVKSFSCGYCAKTFRYNETRRKHEQTHPEFSGVKKYECETCGKDFYDANTLGDHINTHTNVKPYRCDFCDYRTAWSRCLFFHWSKKHEGQKCYPCTYCSMRFVSYDECKDHKKKCKTEKGAASTSSVPQN